MKGKKKRAGVSKAEKLRVAQRVDELVRIRLDGAQWWDVREYVREKEQEDGSPWKLANRQKPLSDGQLRRYVQRADALILGSVKEKRSRAVRRHLAQRRNLYAKAVNAGDIRTALAVAQDEARLQNLYPPKKTELTGKDGSPLQAVTATVELTDDERAAAVASVLARVGQAGDRPSVDQTSDDSRSPLGQPGPAAPGGGDDAGPLANLPPLFPE
jgi:hypothetical protein